LIRAQRTQIEELLAQLDRYRAAWRSARRRARTWRHEADQYQRVADACRRALYRDDVATDIDVEEEVRDAIAAVGIEWDTPHGETPADLVDAIVNHTRPALAKATEQRNRYRLAWRSARRRARRYRAERDGTVRVHPRRQGGSACVGGTRVPVDNIAERHVTGDLADQLTEHREAIAYALRHTLTSWADATGRSEGTAAGTLHRALSWVTGHPTPPRDIPHEVTTLGLEVEDYRGATARVEAHLEHLTR